MIRILPYKQGSRGAKTLADALGARVLKLEGSRWRPRPGDTVINWGNTTPTAQINPAWREARYLNPPGLLRAASNKREFFQLIYRTNPEIIPQFWTRQEDIPDDAFPIVCRTVLAGHSGAGIVIADTRAGLVPAPLYVKYGKKSQEYRVHVGKIDQELRVIAVQRKARNRDIPDDQINWQVRNHSNGFIFAREGFEAPRTVLEVAKTALRCTALDFGAVDVIYNERHQRALVLEINTAPGLEGQTVTDYANFFGEF